MQNIKILKLPSKMNPDVLIVKEMRQRYGSKCPFCNSDRVLDERSRSWYGKRYEEHTLKNILLYLFDKKHNWRVDEYRCDDCYAQWETIPYPTDISKSIDLNNYLQSEIPEISLSLSKLNCGFGNH